MKCAMKALKPLRKASKMSRLPGQADPGFLDRPGEVGVEDVIRLIIERAVGADGPDRVQIVGVR
jgi:hypothetical protein